MVLKERQCVKALRACVGKASNNARSLCADAGNRTGGTYSDGGGGGAVGAGR